MLPRIKMKKTGTMSTNSMILQARKSLWRGNLSASWPAVAENGKYGSMSSAIAVKDRAFAVPEEYPD